MNELFHNVAKRAEEVMSDVVSIVGNVMVWKIRHHFEVLFAISYLIFTLTVVYNTPSTLTTFLTKFFLVPQSVVIVLFTFD